MNLQISQIYMLLRLRIELYLNIRKQLLLRISILNREQVKDWAKKVRLDKLVLCKLKCNMDFLQVVIWKIFKDNQMQLCKINFVSKVKMKWCIKTLEMEMKYILRKIIVKV